MTKKLRRVVLESPFAGDVDLNLRYLRACLRHSLRLGETPFASHGLYTQPGVLDDTSPDERALGIAAGLEWARKAHATVAYVDLGISAGMREGIEHARQSGRLIEQRCLPSETFKKDVLHAEYKARAPKMRLFRLELLIGKDYDTVHSFVVRADDELAARELCASQPGDEKAEAWMDPWSSSCVELPYEAEKPEIVSRNLHSG